MKILICSLTYPLPNGVTVSINTSIDEFLKKGIEIRVVSPDYDLGKFRPEHYPVSSSLLLKNIGVLIGREERTFGINAYFQIKEIADDFCPDAYWLHTLSWAPNAFERYIVKTNKPKVLTYHTMVEKYGGIYAGRLGMYTMRKRSKAVCEKSDAIITPSKTMEKILREYGVTKPIHVIPTGISTSEKHFTKQEICRRFGINKNSKILLYVGRISKEKNLGVLFNLIKSLKYNAVLLLVGPGEIQETIKETLRMGIGERTIFTGGLLKEDVQKIYGACDAFVFSSQSETQGLVIGEAMLSGIPVIALDSPTQKEIYPEDVAVVVRDQSKFATEVVKILENKKKRDELVKRAKDFVSKNFSKEKMTEKQINIFNELINK